MSIRLILFFLLLGAAIWLILGWLVPYILKRIEQKQKKKKEKESNNIGFHIIK